LRRGSIRIFVIRRRRTNKTGTNLHVGSVRTTAMADRRPEGADQIDI
jgi:hypothetical protein